MYMYFMNFYEHFKLEYCKLPLISPGLIQLGKGFKMGL